LFSYSGTTSDIISSIKNFDSKISILLLKLNYKKLCLKKHNIISYRTSSNKGKERGILSFEGAVSPVATFLKQY